MAADRKNDIKSGLRGHGRPRETTSTDRWAAADGDSKHSPKMKNFFRNSTDDRQRNDKKKKKWRGRGEYTTSTFYLQLSLLYHTTKMNTLIRNSSPILRTIEIVEISPITIIILYNHKTQIRGRILLCRGSHVTEEKVLWYSRVDL